MRSALGATTQEGGVPGVDHLRRDRHFSLSYTPSPLPICRIDADVADKGDAGCEFTLSADCRLQTEDGQPGPGYDDAVPQKEDLAGPETQTRDVCNHKAPPGMGADIITIGR